MPVKHIGELFSDPQKYKKHLLKVLLMGLSVALFVVFVIDQRLSQFFGRPDIHDIFWLPAREITNIGLSENYIAIAIAVWIFTRWIAQRISSLNKYTARIDYFRRWSLNFLMALAVSGLITHLIKGLVGRQRPHKSPVFDSLVFEPLTTHWHWHSFSSGHSQVMLTAATMFAVAFPRLRWLWLTFAIAICSTRVMVLDHFLSDTIFGGCIGYVGSIIALKWMKDNTSNGLY